MYIKVAQENQEKRAERGQKLFKIKWLLLVISGVEFGNNELTAENGKNYPFVKPKKNASINFTLNPSITGTNLEINATMAVS